MSVGVLQRLDQNCHVIQTSWVVDLCGSHDCLWAASILNAFEQLGCVVTAEF